MKSRRRPAYKRKKLTRKDFNEIYNEYLDNGIKAGKNLCSRKGYQTTTFYKCLRSEGEINPKWRHPSHCNKWSDDLIDKACMLISNNPILTLEEIIQTMTKNYNAPEIEPTTLSNYLTFSLITLKNVAFHAKCKTNIKFMITSIMLFPSLITLKILKKVILPYYVIDTPFNFQKINIGRYFLPPISFDPNG